MHGLQRLAALILLLVMTSANWAGGGKVTARPHDKSLGSWEKLPFPTGLSCRESFVRDAGIEPGGTIWTITTDGIYYWDGKGFRIPAGDKFIGNPYISALFGGYDRGLYVTQPSAKDHWGKLYKLSDGAAQYVSDFYYQFGGEQPSIYISKSGRIYNRGKQFLAVLTKSGWTRFKAEFGNTPSSQTLVLDTGRKVHFYYNGTLYSIDSKAAFQKHKLPPLIKSVSGTGYILGALWGQNRIMRVESGGKSVQAIDLETFKQIPTQSINAALKKCQVHDMFSAADGAVWVLVNDALQGNIFFRVTSRGEVMQMKETARFADLNSHYANHPDAVLNAPDSSIWLGIKTGGTAQYKNGSWRIYDWKAGFLFGSVNLLFADAKGNVYAACNKGICAFHPEKAAELPAQLSIWREYENAPRGPIRDGNGNVWLFLKERPRQVSCWDGYEFHHFQVPFDTERINDVLADDRSHILLSEWNSKYELLTWYDVSAQGVTRFKDIQSMLVAAVANGATRFQTELPYTDCYVLPGGKICFSYPWDSAINYFDGKRWKRFTFEDDVVFMYESHKYGIIFYSGTNYYSCDQKQLMKIKVSDENTHFLLGPKYIQLYEEELMRQRPDLYVPLDRREDRRLYFSAGQDEFTKATGNRLSLGSCIATIARAGGCWVISGNIPCRVFGNRAFVCDVSESPLAGKESDTRGLFDDKAGNIWIKAGWYGGAHHVFMKRLTEFSLKMGDLPEKAKDSLSLTVQPVLPGLDAEKLRLYWRFVSGPWQGGNSGSKLTIPFPSSGTFNIELVGMDQLGGLSKPVKFSVSAEVSPREKSPVSGNGEIERKDKRAHK